jgi:outer membrane murein-binding lipoprotein Lpp
MSRQRIIAAAVLLLILSPLAPAQSLAEAAKKEKERRENLKGTPSIVVTNADLAKTTKKPAVETTPAEGEKTDAPGAPPPAQGTDKSYTELQAEALKKSAEKKAELESRWNRAQELVELLNLKMNALWQQFFTFNSMTPKDQIQKEISETFQRFQAAQGEEAKAKEELNKFLAQGPSAKFPPAAIR